MSHPDQQILQLLFVCFHAKAFDFKGEVIETQLLAFEIVLFGFFRFFLADIEEQETQAKKNVDCNNDDENDSTGSFQESQSIHLISTFIAKRYCL